MTVTSSAVTAAAEAKPADGGAGSDRVPTVGFVGLGRQGEPMARRVLRAGFPLVVCDRRSEVLQGCVGEGAAVAGSSADVGRRCQVVSICVLDDSQLEEIVAGPGGLLTTMLPGGVILVHSTVDPETCVRLARRAAASGIGLVDAPVSGGADLAERGELLVMVGGDRATVERCRPILDSFADVVVHLGPVGTGQRAKLVNNLLFAAHLGLASDTFALGRDLGISNEDLAAVLTHGSGYSTAVSATIRFGYSVSTRARSVGPLLLKDVRLAACMAERESAELGVLAAAADEALRLTRYER